jgi:hypothetical protein
MKPILAVSFAVVYGLSLRILFGVFDELLGIMTVGFLLLSPVIIGFLTVIVLPKGRVGPTASFFLPWLTSGVILVITIWLNIEGMICWMMLFPIFAILAGIGGTVAYRMKHRNKSDIDDWQKPTTFYASVFAVLPAFAALAEGERTLVHKEYLIKESVVIPASPAAVWWHLTHIGGIAKPESKGGMANMMGFPRHLHTVLDSAVVGGKRKAVYEKGLYFDETIVAMEPEKRLVLDIKTDPYNIPPTVMDEHILIGGKHVDILQDIYTIERLSDSTCRLNLSSRFFINTPINWYAGIWAKYLMSDILESEIELIKERATAGNGRLAFR